MYSYGLSKPTAIQVNMSSEGETIENKVARLLNNKEPIGDGVEPLYTKRSEGVLPDYNVRSDKFEYAIEAMDKVTASKKAKRDERQKALGEKAKENQQIEEKTQKEVGKPESTAGTGGSETPSK